MPQVLRPVEKVANLFGAELNDFPGYVMRNTSLHRFAKVTTGIALDEEAGSHATLLPGGEVFASDAVLQTQDV